MGHLCWKYPKGILFHAEENPGSLEQSTRLHMLWPQLQPRSSSAILHLVLFYLRHRLLLADLGRLLPLSVLPRFYNFLPKFLQVSLQGASAQIILKYNNPSPYTPFPILLTLLQFPFYHLSLHDALYRFASLLIKLLLCFHYDISFVRAKTYFLTPRNVSNA